MASSNKSVLEPVLIRLIGYLDEIRPIINSGERTEEDTEKLQNMLLKIKRVVKLLEEKTEKWDKSINELPVEERGAERLVFNSFLQGEKHLTEWMDNGREAIDDIEIALADNSEVGSTQSELSEELGNRDRRNLGNNQAQTNREYNGVPQHLPRAKLPEFWGDQLRWPEFWQAFERTVDHLDIDWGLKAHYLIQCLRGKAKRTVMGYRPIAEHYVPLKESLERQFGNKKAIRDTLHAELINLPVANESSISLRAYLEEVERICRSLLAMGHSEDESIIMMAIKNKLPRSVVLELLKMEKVEGIQWDVKKLREGLSEIVALREEAQRCTQTLNSRYGPSRGQINNNNSNNNKFFNINRNNQKKYEPARVFALSGNNE